MSSRQVGGIERDWKALLVCPDRALASELGPTLPDAVRVLGLTGQNSYPPWEMLSREISKQRPDLCFLDFVTCPEEAFGILSRLTEQRPAPAVIGLLPHDNPELVLRCLRRGAAGVLLQPFCAGQLELVLGRIADLYPKDPGPPVSRARTLAVIPVKGSCGATTVASNLACHARSAGAGSVLLADMDPVASTLSFQLKLRSQYSFLDAITHCSELDAELWRALVTNCRGVDVLPSPETPSGGAVEGHDPTEIVDYARQRYHFVFLDLGSPYGPWNTALVHSADEVVAVLSSEIPAVYSAQRMLVHLERQGVAKAKLRMVVNRDRRDAGLGIEEIETALGMEVFSALPNDPDAIGKALMEGRPVAANSELGKALGVLAAYLGCLGSPTRKSPAGGRFFSLFSR